MSYLLEGVVRRVRLIGSSSVVGYLLFAHGQFEVLLLLVT